ncbi:MAG: T9SS type A sorting domain-containing protein [Flavobacteriales bacterium]|nr:T9SS type A sorting domain-containing protein [Flavobacteriales bacterium]
MILRRIAFVLAVFGGISLHTYGQSALPFSYFDLWLEEVTIPQFPAFHSGVTAHHDGKWLIMGGRTNGMHGFYPPFAFPTNGRQELVYVVDPEAGSIWSADISGLDSLAREQLGSSNMQFAQKDDKLYITGGYGYKESIDDYTTFPYLTSVNMPMLMDSVIAGGDISSAFRSVIDSTMAVTGGRMGRIGDRYFLVFGHYFHHRYSVADLGSFIQKYTYQIRMFDIQDDAVQLAAINKQVVTDSANFRRRDFNMTPFEEGTEKGFYAWSGVFRDSVDLPYYNPIRITSDGSYEVLPFEQKLAHYHSGSLSISLENSFLSSDKMHVFFGGMAEYYPDEFENLIQDSLVPFIKQISSVQVYSDGLVEHYNGVNFSTQDYCGTYAPNQIRFAFEEFEGSNMEFIPNPQYMNEETGVMNYELDFQNPTLNIGYMVGGIISTGRNIADMNDPSLSFASNKVYKVFAEVKNCGNISEYSTATMQVFPNPSTDFIQAQTDEPVTRWDVTDLSGKTVLSQNAAGQSLYVGNLASGTYLLHITTQQNAYRAKFIKR